MSVLGFLRRRRRALVCREAVSLMAAYLDGELDPTARAAVDGHLRACGLCRSHVAQLRATTALLRALPDPVPTRRLTPRLGVPAWLAPMRTLMTLASGAAAFLFIYGLKRMSSPVTARSGTVVAGVGMLVATLASFLYVFGIADAARPHLTLNLALAAGGGATADGSGSAAGALVRRWTS